MKENIIDNNTIRMIGYKLGKAIQISVMVIVYLEVWETS